MKFIISLFIPLAVGGMSGFFTIKAIPGWYATLNKPWFNPPNWLFSPVWTALYIMMGISLWLVWKTKAEGRIRQKAFYLFGAQLVLNFLWSLLFFNLHQIGVALVEILLLWGTLLCTIIAFARVNKTSAWLLVPYISWVSFATVLNYGIWALNKS